MLDLHPQCQLQTYAGACVPGKLLMTNFQLIFTPVSSAGTLPEQPGGGLGDRLQSLDHAEMDPFCGHLDESYYKAR